MTRAIAGTGFAFALAVLATSMPLAAAESPQAGDGAAEARCNELTHLTMAHAAVTHADWLMQTSIPVRGPHGTETKLELGPHCAVDVVSSPVPDSQIHIMLWLPAASSWNSALLATGNGGYSSQMSLPEMAEGLQRGYAVGGSDTGHTGDGLNFGVGHPEKIRDWAYRAVHELAMAEAAVATRFYEQKPKHAYFRGCSTGGQQALSEAQRYPADFDGIVAGDPGNDRIRLNADFVASWAAAHPAAGPAFPHSKLPLVAAAAMHACDRLDGVADGVISDPPACQFDPAVLACKPGGFSDDCLTPDEVRTVHSLYKGPVHDDDGHSLFFGWPRGSELGWSAYIVDPPAPVRVAFWTSWVSPNKAFEPHAFSAEKAIADARRKYPYIDALSPDLNAFVSRGGKLLLYHGWADPVVPPEDTLAYVDMVRHATLGNSVALFMVPGMGHCGGGPGATVFDALGALDTWVQSGKVPTMILAKKLDGGQTVMERPLCPYPQQAYYDNKSDPSKATSFTCRADTPQVRKSRSQ